MKRKLLVFICIMFTCSLFARNIDGLWIAKSLYDYWIKNPYVEDLPAKTYIINNKTYLSLIDNFHIKTDKMIFGPWQLLSIDEIAEDKVKIVLRTYSDKNEIGTLIITFLDEDLVIFSKGECSETFLKELHGSDLDADGKTQYIRKILDNEPKVTVTEGALMRCTDNLRLRQYGGFFGKVTNSMKKGTKVKVLEIGNENYVDGIVSNWVQVEVIENSFDKDGKLLPKGTHGWCFGAYLTPLENSK